MLLCWICGHFQLYINGVLYCSSFPADYTVANVSGLAGGHTYELVLECIPVSNTLLPLRSNVVRVRCNERVSFTELA